MRYRSTAHIIDFTDGKVLKKLIIFALPIVLTSFLSLLFNTVDMIVVGRFTGADGTLYQSAVSATGTACNLIVSIIAFLPGGASIALAMAFGKKDVDEQNRVIHTSYALAIVLGLSAGIVGFVCGESLLRFLKTPPEIIDYSTKYIKIYFLGVPAMVIYNFGAGLFRAYGETRKPLYYLAVSGCLNVVINVVTVVCFDMNVVGVALGTAAAQYLCAAWVTWDWIRNKGETSYQIRKTRFHAKELKTIIRFGVPIAIGAIAYPIAGLFTTPAMNAYGSVVLAGNTINGTVDNYYVTAGASIARAVETAIGQNIGAKKYRRVRSVTNKGFIFTWVLYALGVGTTFLFGEQLYAIFNKDTAVIDVALHRRNILAPMLLIGCFATIYGGALTGMGNTFMPMICNIAFAGVLPIVWVKYIYPLHQTLDMLYYMLIAVNVLCAITQLFMFIICYKILRRKGEKEQILFAEENA